MIRFQGVTKSFAGLNLFRDISFELKAHEIAAVLGPSGIGKTTLLRLIAGTLQPDSGTIETGSQRIGFIFQDHRLLPWRTAEDNIAVVLKAQGFSRENAGEKARHWLDQLGLKNFYDYYPGQLSGGMVQRVSIARAFAVEPEIMLMDEPFGSLDPDLVDTLIRDLRLVLREHRSTTIYVTHDLIEALSIADRMFRLSHEGLKEIDISDRESLLHEHCANVLKNLAG
jgi:ABC-type nitrate/sulfonate/bicarbonate transport system ATPase subunit